MQLNLLICSHNLIQVFWPSGDHMNHAIVSNDYWLGFFSPLLKEALVRPSFVEESFNAVKSQLFLVFR